MPYVEFRKLAYDERQRLEKLFYAELGTYYDKAMMYRGYKATWKECSDLRRKFAGIWERKGNYVPVDFYQRYYLI